MAGAGLAQQRLFCFAALDGFRTARVEPAAGWRLERAGHIPFQDNAPRGELFRNPRHPYTKALMSAIPVPDPRNKRERIILKGDVPSPIKPPSGCRFHTRCPEAIERCKTEEPLLRETSAGHWTSCLLVN